MDGYAFDDNKRKNDIKQQDDRSKKLTTIRRNKNGKMGKLTEKMMELMRNKRNKTRPQVSRENHDIEK